MEKSIKEIDKIIKEKLINYEEDPSPEFWSRLNGRLKRPGIISGVLFFMVLLAGMLFWLIMPKLDAEIVSDQILIDSYTITNANSKQAKEQEIEKTSFEEQKINEKAISHSSIKPQENADIESEQSEVTKSIVEINKKTEIISIDPKIQKTEIILDYGNRINQIKPKSISKIIYDDKNQNHLSKKEIEFGSNSSVNKMYSCGRFSLSLELGRNISWKSLSGDSQYQNFIDYREANEEITTNTLFGFKFNYHIKNWVVSSGLTYTSIGEKLNYNMTETVVQSNGGYFVVDTIWASVYDPDIGWEPMVIGYDRTWVEEYVTESINYKIDNINTYSYFEVPILIAYNFNKGKFAIRPAMGVSLGLLYSASGKLPTINPPDFSELSGESVYLKPMLSNLIFDLSFEYSINQNYGIFIKPFYKKGLNSIYINYPLSGNYNNAGVKIGVNICIQ